MRVTGACFRRHISQAHWQAGLLDSLVTACQFASYTYPFLARANPAVPKSVFTVRRVQLSKEQS